MSDRYDFNGDGNCDFRYDHLDLNHDGKIGKSEECFYWDSMDHDMKMGNGGFSGNYKNQWKHPKAAKKLLGKQMTSKNDAIVGLTLLLIPGIILIFIFPVCSIFVLLLLIALFVVKRL